MQHRLIKDSPRDKTFESKYVDGLNENKVVAQQVFLSFCQVSFEVHFRKHTNVLTRFFVFWPFSVVQSCSYQFGINLIVFRRVQGRRQSRKAKGENMRLHFKCLRAFQKSKLSACKYNAPVELTLTFADTRSFVIDRHTRFLTDAIHTAFTLAPDCFVAMS